MSPVSRGRRGRSKSRSTRRQAPPDVFSTPQACDCPTCSAADFDPQQLIDDLLAGAAELFDSDDPLDAEVAGAAFLSIGEVAGEEFETALIDGFIPEFEARASAAAIAILLAIGSVTAGRTRAAASAAVDRLVATGVRPPQWAAELDEPVTVSDCWRLVDTEDTASMLLCRIYRAGRAHTVVLSADHTDCGAASDLMLFHADFLAEALQTIQVQGRDKGLEITTEALDPAEFRWHVEAALDARAVHERDERDLGIASPPADDDELPGYRALAVLLRTRMRALPEPSRPPAPHGPKEGQLAGLPTALEALMSRLAGQGSGPLSALASLVPGSTVAALPTKREASDGVAPVYQLKVELRGAKPPIWRRLEVPADISLAHLHTVIQVAFDWYDSHLHVFETPYGEFGTSDAELGHHPEAPVTLEQVAPGTRSKIRYTYDFGDDWEHDILVEKVLDRDTAARYPRCTGGRRAAPPEDCGGVWGYANLVEILADPSHPEHEDMLEWLGLDDAEEFDPADFDAKAITQALSRVC